jgi:hypothetical protein
MSTCGKASQPITVTLDPANDAFSIADDRCSGSSLAANGSCAFQVCFSPSSPGPHNTVIEVTYPDDTVVGAAQAAGTGIAE